MFIRKFLFLLLSGLYTTLFLFPGNFFAQPEAMHWFFGDRAGLNFTTAPVSPQTGQLYSVEGCTSISDNQGNLLFYSDGITVYDARHNVIPGGTDLYGHSSSTQSGIFVQHPGNPDLYYIFTAEGWENRNNRNAGLRYTLIDRTLNGGLGAVVLSEKNVPLISNITEKICGFAENSGDIWMVTLGRPPAGATTVPVNTQSSGYYNTLYAIKITSTGIVSNVVASTLTGMDFQETHGYMKFSPDGSMLAIAGLYDRKFYLSDFDLSTGTASRLRPLPLPHNFFPYGVEFSPNGNFLYVQGTIGWGNTSTTEIKLLQYDLRGSTYSYTELLPAGATGYRSALQKGPDGKIYMSESFHYNNGSNAISVINNPDAAGTACDFQRYSVRLSSGTVSYQGLPQFVYSVYVRLQAGDVCSDEAAVFEIYASSPVDHVDWDFGDGNTGTSTASQPNTRSIVSHQYTAPGTYTVTATVYLVNGAVRTLTYQIEVYPVPLIYPVPPLEKCDEDTDGLTEFNLNNAIPDILNGRNPSGFEITFYETAADAANRTNPVPNPGAYRNTVPYQQTMYYNLLRIATGCDSTGSFDLRVYPAPQINMPDRYFICRGDSVYVEAPAGFVSYLWNTGDTIRGIYVSRGGIYFVEVTDANGCSATKEIEVVESGGASIDTVYVYDFNGMHNSIRIVVAGNGDYEYSLDGINYQDSNVFTDLPPGNYTVYARDKGGCGEDIFEIRIFDAPSYFSPNGDGIHDRWHILNIQSAPGSEVYIYNRYGVMLYKLSSGDAGWDGTYRGYPQPSDDYWFVVFLHTYPGVIRTVKGHFSLIR